MIVGFTQKTGSLVRNQKNLFRKVLEEAEGPRATGPFIVQGLAYLQPTQTTDAQKYSAV